MSAIAVLTTINFPTETVKKLSEVMSIIVVPDEKTPKDWEYKNAECLDRCLCNGLELPRNHYSRKNIGYLEAIKNKASVIYDVDDDSTPNVNFQFRQQHCNAFEIHKPGWCNIYTFFTNDKVWPRGLPLQEVNHRKAYMLPDATVVNSPIQQGLVDDDPDVDAIWRLTNNTQIKFKIRRSVYLSPGVWCPFNSQSTHWFPEAYPLMYLPVNAPFRMCDIWRSFVAQRCLWEKGMGVTFHSPAEVYQDRNPHNLMHDFQDEMLGYLYNDKIVQKLTDLKLGSDIFENMFLCYKEFIKMTLLPESELITLSQWIKEVKKVWNNH